MHEHSISHSLLARVLEACARRRAAAVKSIRIELGVLSGYDARHLVESFAIVAAGTLAEGARIDVVPVPLRVHCPACDGDSTVTADNLDCPLCFHPDTLLIDGDEVRLADVELSRAGDAP
jgi:hydrogenase nickel incorporation protein HypA/HybF